MSTNEINTDEINTDKINNNEKNSSKINSSENKSLITKKIILLIAVIVLTVILIFVDQIIKNYIVSNIELNSEVSFWPGFIYLMNLHNYGAAFSSFQNKKALLLIVGILFLAVIFLIVIKLPAKSKFIPAYIFLSMLIGGGVGNMADRIRLGYVVDYIGLDFWKSYPIFNFADCCVVLGVIGLFILFIFVYKEDDLKFLKFTKTNKDKSDDNNSNG